MAETITLRVRNDSDVTEARRAARQFAAAAGFPRVGAEEIVLATLELATNLARYARHGFLVLQPIATDRGKGVQIESHDEGPGIPDIDLAMQDGYSTGGSLGSGLPSVRRMMDEFTITSGPDGTHITARKWLT